MNDIKNLLPWWVKIGSKIILSRLPVGYRLWRSLGVFVNGEISYQTVWGHISRSEFEDLQGQVILELGPGDSLLNALVCSAMGARRFT